MIRSFIFLDTEDIQNSIEMLEVVNRMYKDYSYETYGLLINPKYENDLCGFDNIITVYHEGIKDFDIENITSCIEELQIKYDFDSILIPATQLGRSLAPKVAMRLDVGLVADVTDINNNDGEIEMIRPAFDGKMLATIISRKAKPVMMSVRPNVFVNTLKVTKETKEIRYVPKRVKEPSIKLLETRPKEKAKDIRESDVLISGGGGIVENFESLQLLAKELDGMVSASRRIVDSGIAPRSIQVGQSGKTVTPKLYIALGIHGTLQHIQGLKNVENIISVNTNTYAPICSLSDVVVQGDAHEFVNKLIERINK